ncbi:hypothetical protein ABE504_24150 [Paenibacillus oryzisoli]|uniref:hypothetical protein n=1 Tax=Paenibacillus oryzisoli TaxID=1850517 RepID=UPI003D296F5C
MSQLLVKSSLLSTWLGPHKDVQRLQLATLLRSVGQGLALVDISLFLKELGWSGGAIGTVLALAGLLRTGLTLFTAELGRLLGAKRCLLLFEGLVLLGAVLAVFFSQQLVLDAAFMLSGLGGGHAGTGGPMAPIERRWLAAYDRKKTGHVYHTNALLSCAGLGAGCLLACLHLVWSGLLPGASGYRPIFLLLVALSAGSIVLLLRLQGGERKAPAPAAPQAEPAVGKKANDFALFAGLVLGALVIGGLFALFRRLGWHEVSLYAPIVLFLVLLLIPNLRLLVRRSGASGDARTAEELKQLVTQLSGIAGGLTSTMTSYWFAVRFNASPGWIGVVMGLSYLAAGGWSYLAPKHAEKIGTVRVVVILHLLAIACLLALPWTTSFWVAALLEIGCTACNLGTRGNRTAMLMEEAPRGKRSLIVKMNYVILRLGAVLWPGAFGKFIDAGRMVAPFYIVGALQLLATFLFASVYGKGRKPTPM